MNPHIENIQELLADDGQATRAAQTAAAATAENIGVAPTEQGDVILREVVAAVIRSYDFADDNGNPPREELRIWADRMETVARFARECAATLDS